VDDLSVHRSAG